MNVGDIMGVRGPLGNAYPWDALEGIHAEAECIHTPDMLEFLGMEQSNAGIVLHYKCSCGQEIDEVTDSQAVTETTPIL